jgi:hypothetical protein
MRRHLRVDVGLSGEVIRVTSVVDIVGILVHPNIVNLQGSRES